MVFYVKTMCRILKVTRSRYYFWLKKPLSQRQIQEKITITYNEFRTFARGTR
jgi:hypothetical protein